MFLSVFLLAAAGMVAAQDNDHGHAQDRTIDAALDRMDFGTIVELPVARTKAKSCRNCTGTAPTGKCLEKIGAPGRIRTPDPQIRSLVL